MATNKPETNAQELTTKMVKDVLGKERVEALSNQAACETNGGFEKVLQGACATVAGMYPGKPKAQAVQAAIVVIQACGSKANKDDLVKLMKESGQEPVALRHLKGKEARAKKKELEVKKAAAKKA